MGFDNFCYIIYSKKNAIIIDPGIEPRKITDFIKKNNLTIKYIIITHHHSDHTYGINIIKKQYPKSEILTSKKYYNKKDNNIEILVDDGYKLKIDDINLFFILTPGHTPDGICIIANNKFLFTGDTLFVGDSGATVFKDSNRQDLGKSIRKLLSMFPSGTIIWPGHDFGDKKYSTLKHEQLTNKNSDEYKMKSISWKMKN